MPSSSAKKIGLALSGGGYRATAFHLGTLKQLEEMGILAEVDVISTISGGSITGACYCSFNGTFDEFYADLYVSLQKKDVIRKVLLSWIGFRFLLTVLLLLGSLYLLFTPLAWLFPIVIAGILIVICKFQFSLFPISKRIEKIYNQFFYKSKTLGELPNHPALVIGSTNLQTARQFSFSKFAMQDSTYEFMDEPVKFLPADFPVARAVMASSCVPFAFTPVTIDRKYFQDPARAAHYHPLLVDGGVYDNQGIHKVMQQGAYACNYVITSDAGAGSTGELKFKNTISLLMETVNVFMSRIKKEQMRRNVYDNAATANKQIAYFSLGWDVENCINGFIDNLDKKQVTESVIEAHQLEPEWINDPKQFKTEITDHLKKHLNYYAIPAPTAQEKQIARAVGTNLTALNKQQVDCLIKQARALTQLQVKLYCPSLINNK
jgi:NTE family protein